MLDKNTINNEKQQVDWLKYINTLILTFIFGFTVMCFTSINSVKTIQVEQGKELVRLKTVQDTNVTQVAFLNSRVSSLELNQMETIKNWVDLNFVRK